MKVIIQTMLISIVGTGVGGLISYLATIKLQEKKEKRKIDLENLKNNLIPLYQYLESSIFKFKNFNFEKKDFEYLFEELKQNLNVSKKIYFSSKINSKLEKYYEDLNHFNKIFNKETRKISNQYLIYINKLLKDYNSKKTPAIINGKEFEINLKKLILKKSTLVPYDLEILLNQIVQIDIYDNKTEERDGFYEVKKNTINVYSSFQTSLNHADDIATFIFEKASLNRLEEIIQKNESIINLKNTFNSLVILKNEVESEIEKIIKL